MFFCDGEGGGGGNCLFQELKERVWDVLVLNGRNWQKYVPWRCFPLCVLVDGRNWQGGEGTEYVPWRCVVCLPDGHTPSTGKG